MKLFSLKHCGATTLYVIVLFLALWGFNPFVTVFYFTLRGLTLCVNVFFLTWGASLNVFVWNLPQYTVGPHLVCPCFLHYSVGPNFVCHNFLSYTVGPHFVVNIFLLTYTGGGVGGGGSICGSIFSSSHSATLLCMSMFSSLHCGATLPVLMFCS